MRTEQQMHRHGPDRLVGQHHDLPRLPGVRYRGQVSARGAVAHSTPIALSSRGEARALARNSRYRYATGVWSLPWLPEAMDSYGQRTPALRMREALQRCPQQPTASLESRRSSPRKPHICQAFVRACCRRPDRLPTATWKIGAPPAALSAANQANDLRSTHALPADFPQSPHP